MKYEFYDLPRVLQDRLIESSRGAAVPLCLGFVERKDQKSLFWLLAALVTAGAWGACALHGYGQLEHPAALGGPLYLGLSLLISTIFFGLLVKSYASLWRKEQRPLKEGRYLFAACILEFRAGRVIETPLHDAEISEAPRGVSIRSAAGETFRFTALNEPEKLLPTLKEAQQKWRNSSESDRLARARLHPLVDSGVPNPLAPTQPLVRKRLAPLSSLLALVLVVGILVGWGGYHYRNLRSEKLVYRQAVEENTVESYRAYLLRGGERKDVESLYLPRAELLVAREKGTVAAIEEFLEKNAESRIIEEVRAFHRQALLDELEKAKAENTVLALDDLPKRFKAYRLIEAELKSARHALYENALKDFSEKSGASDEQTLAAVQALLKYSEFHGPQVLVRVRQSFTQDREILDRIVLKSRKYFLGRRSLPTQYFVGESIRALEKQLSEKFISELQPYFSSEFLEFKPAPLLEKENLDWPASTVPTLSVLHSEKLSGGYVGGKPKGIYLGASVRFKSTLEVPGHEKSLKSFSWNVWRHPDFRLLEDKGANFELVYGTMMSGAFERFGQKYLSSWAPKKK